MTHRIRLHIEELEDRRTPSFTSGEIANVGGYPVVADFNSDGSLDLATVTGNETDTIMSVVLGNGDGTFQESALNSGTGLGPNGPYPQSVVSGDFNGDGTLDLAAAVYDYSGITNDVLILIGNGDGTFAAAQPATITQGYTSSYIVTGDVDRDGKLDLVVTSDDAYGMGGQSVSVRLGRGDGTFTHAATYEVHDAFPFGDYPISIYTPVLADFNGDGDVDVAVPGGDFEQAFVKVFLSNGDGTLQQPSNAVAYPSNSYAAIYTVIAGDFNADSRPDLAADGGIWLNRNNGTFENIGAIGAASDDAGDVNGDGVLDLVATNGGDLLVFLGYGDGGFAPPTTIATGVTYLGDVVLADHNADSRFDATVWGDGLVSVMLNDGDWPLTEVPHISISISISDVTKTEGKKNQTSLFTFTVTLSAAYDQPVTVSFRTVNGTATTSNSDYVAQTGTLTFAPGQTTKTITVEVKGDPKKEANETFTVELFNASSNALLLDAIGLGTILNDD